MKEIIIKEKFNSEAEKLRSSGYTEKDMVLNKEKLVSRVSLLGIPLTVIILFMFFKIRPDAGMDFFPGDMILNLICMILLFVLLVALHEFLQGLIWSSKGEKQSGKVNYRFSWRTMLSKAKITEAISQKKFIQGLTLPIIILGIIPVLIGFIIPSYTLALSGALMISYSISDLMIRNLASQVDEEDKNGKSDTNEIMILSLPDNPGFAKFELNSGKKKSENISAPNKAKKDKKSKNRR